MHELPCLLIDQIDEVLMVEKLNSSSTQCNRQLQRLVKQFSFALVNYFEKLSIVNKLKSNEDYNYYTIKCCHTLLKPFLKGLKILSLHGILQCYYVVQMGQMHPGVEYLGEDTNPWWLW